MTNEYEFTVRFTVPDNVSRQNVRRVLRKFFNDLVDTDRFIDTTIEVNESSMDEAEASRLEKMLGCVEDEEISLAESFIEDMQSDEE